MTPEQRLHVVDSLLNELWVAFSAVNDTIGQDRTDALALNHPYDENNPLEGMAAGPIGNADPANPAHSVPTITDLAQKELMAAIFQREDFQATDV